MDSVDRIRGRVGDDAPSETRASKGYVKWTILAVTTLSSFMSTFDSNVVSIALPTIGHEFTSGVSLLGWAVSGYVLAVAVVLLQAGKIGDLYGRKKVYLMGFALFGLSSALCGASQGIYEFIALRVLQGITAGFMGATSGPLVFESFPPRQRGMAIGTNSIAWVIGAITGPVLGGLLVVINWRLIFYVNVPIALIGVLIGRKVIPSYVGHRIALAPENKINLVSSAIFGLTIASIFILLTFSNAYFGLLGLLGVIAFVLFERRSPNPLISRGLIRSKGFVLSLLSIVCVQMAILAVPFVFSFYYQVAAGYPPEVAGLWITPFPLFYALSNPLGGRVFDKLRVPARASMVAALVSGASIILMGLTVPGPVNPALIAVLLAMLSLSNGIVWAPTMTSAYTFAGQSLRGLAAGTTATFGNVGLATSIAIVTSIFTSLLPRSTVSQIYLGDFQSLTPAQIELFKQGTGTSLLVLGAILLLAAPLLFLLAREQRKSHFQDRNTQTS